MPSTEEHLMEWLRNTHAMELKSELMLKSQVSRLADHPTICARFESHLQETRRQAELLRDCIQHRGGSVSTAKDLGAKLLGMGQAAAIYVNSDALITECLESAAFEAMETASYRILTAAAEQAGDSRTAQVCRQILQEEEAMEQWVKVNLAAITRTFLTQTTMPAGASLRL
jgi:ferritin-like metal-binding protein YciE